MIVCNTFILMLDENVFALLNNPIKVFQHHEQQQNNFKDSGVIANSAISHVTVLSHLSESWDHNSMMLQ